MYIIKLKDTGFFLSQEEAYEVLYQCYDAKWIDYLKNYEYEGLKFGDDKVLKWLIGGLIKNDRGGILLLNEVQRANREEENYKIVNKYAIKKGIMRDRN